MNGFMRHAYGFVACCVLLAYPALPLFGQAAEDATNPSQMLELMKIDDSLLGQFLDDRPVAGNEQEPLLRLLFRLPTFAQVDVDRWSRSIDTTVSIQALCDQHRFEFFTVEGQVESIEKIEIIPELTKRLGFAHYFKLTISGRKAKSIVFVRELPKTWGPAFDRSEQIVEPVRAQGLLLKKQPVGEATGLVFAASRIQWYPAEASTSLRSTEDQVLLSNMGVDIGQLAEVQQRATMTGVDRESFYQLLAAVHHSESTQLEKLARREFEIARMIRTPENVVGELYSLSGTARRAIRIEVDDPDISKRFGIDHYFEVEIFMPMERSVRFVDKKQDARVFRDYPFVFCVPDLPGNMPTGDDIRVDVHATGFFLKLWAYRTEFMAEVTTRDAKPARQLSPLMIGPTVVPVGNTPPVESRLSLIIAVLFVTGLILVWLVMWRAGIKDRHRAKQLFEKNQPRDASFQNLG